MSELTALMHYPDSRAGADRLLLVMLPGAGIAAEDFALHGLVAAAQTGGPIVDVIAAKPDQVLYLDGTVAQALEQSVLVPAYAAGYQRIWLLGISLGGMGALSCTVARPNEIEGLILLAPFIGTHGTMAELARAGGFAGWRPEASAATPPEREILTWLQHRLAVRPGHKSGWAMPARIVSLPDTVYWPLRYRSAKLFWWKAAMTGQPGAGPSTHS